ncbi:hypothetical protein G9A89_008481 [Geosiphon pyriformis]|nr:hypothetical protein G9A89_008481 [Geosiphon pyriformis]
MVRFHTIEKHLSMNVKNAFLQRSESCAENQGKEPKIIESARSNLSIPTVLLPSGDEEFGLEDKILFKQKLLLMVLEYYSQLKEHIFDKSTRLKHPFLRILQGLESLFRSTFDLAGSIISGSFPFSLHPFLPILSNFERVLDIH